MERMRILILGVIFLLPIPSRSSQQSAPRIASHKIPEARGIDVSFRPAFAAAK